METEWIAVKEAAKLCEFSVGAAYYHADMNWETVMIDDMVYVSKADVVETAKTRQAGLCVVCREPVEPSRGKKPCTYCAGCRSSAQKAQTRKRDERRKQLRNERRSKH